MNAIAAPRSLLANKVSLGAEMSVAAGPVGRDARAATDANVTAEIRRIPHAGTLCRRQPLWRCAARRRRRQQGLYGVNVNAREVLLGDTVPMPVVAEPL